MRSYNNINNPNINPYLSGRAKIIKQWDYKITNIPYQLIVQYKNQKLIKDSGFCDKIIDRKQEYKINKPIMYIGKEIHIHIFLFHFLNILRFVSGMIL